MWRYEKRLQYPVKISQPNPKMAQFIMSQYGGPDGEMGASMRYLSQRYAMPYDVAKASLTDIGTEELAHLEIVAAIIHQLTRNLTPQKIEESGLALIILTIQPVSGHRQQVVFRLIPVNFNPKEIRLQICLKILLRNKRHAAPMITFFAS